MSLFLKNLVALQFFTIGIYTDTENVPPHTLELVEHFLKRIESYLLHNVDAWQNSPFPYETFLVDILDDRLSNPEIIKQKAAFYQVDSEINYRLYCIELEEYDTTISRYLIKNMLQGSNAMRSILYKDSIVILRVVNDNPMLEEDAVQSWTQNLHNILKIYDFRCGASAIFQGLCHVRWAYKEARSALQLGKRLSDSEERIFCHDDYYAYHILDSIADTEAVEGFVLKSLFSLIEDDLKRNNNGTRLLETYLNANLSITDTARLLSMHRNSVHYRIRRLEEMLGIDFSNHNAVIQVDMSIKILRYLIYVKKKYREYQPLFPIQGPFDSQ